MATQAQIEANRANSQQSTGPRTDVGKQTASRNAVTHGFWSADAVIPGEDPAVFERFARGVRAELHPAGVLQGDVVERLIHLHWKRRRMPRLEAELVKRLMAGGEFATPDQAMAADLASPRSLVRILQQHEMRIERAIQTNMKELLRLQAEAAKAEPSLEELEAELFADLGITKTSSPNVNPRNEPNSVASAVTAAASATVGQMTGKLPKEDRAA